MKALICTFLLVIPMFVGANKSESDLSIDVGTVAPDVIGLAIKGDQHVEYGRRRLWINSATRR